MCYKIQMSKKKSNQKVSYTKEGKVILIKNDVEIGFGEILKWDEKTNYVLAEMKNVPYDYYHDLSTGKEIPYDELSEVLIQNGFVPEFEEKINDKDMFYVWAHLEKGILITIETYGGTGYNTIKITIPNDERIPSGFYRCREKIGLENHGCGLQTYNIASCKGDTPIHAILSLSKDIPDWNGQTPSLWHYGERMDGPIDFEKALRKIYKFKHDLNKLWNMRVEETLRKYVESEKRNA